jgi:putative RecB family exonuclease
VSILEQLFPSEAPALAWPSGLPDHLSPSSLKTWMRCREQWRQVYLLGKRQRPAAAMIWGSAHNFALVEQNFAQKIGTGEDLSVGDVELAFAEGFDQRVDREDVDWKSDKPAEIKDRGVKLAAAYHQTVSASVQPLTVEESFSIDVPGVPVPVVGRMDVTEETRTIDLKTGGKREMNADNVFQGRVYQLARPVTMEFHLATKTKVPGIYTPPEYPEFGFAYSEAEQARTRMVLALLAADIVSTYERFGPDQTWPGAFTYGWACSYCGFKPTCEYWAGSQVPGGPFVASGEAAGAGDVPAADASGLSFGDTLAGVTATPARLEAQRLALTRTLLDIGDKRGSLPTVVAAIDSNHKSRPLAEHIVWLRAQLERATEVIA